MTRRGIVWLLSSIGAVLLLAIIAVVVWVARPAGTAAPTSAPPTDTTATAAPTGPVAPGEHKWNTLFGGECVTPFTDAWAETFTVVDCTTPHAAQLVATGKVDGAEGAAYPGEAALTTQVNGFCRAEGVFDRAALTGIDDLQVQAAFPVESQWAAGERQYFCFASRSGGGTFEKSITPAAPPAANSTPTPTATP